MLVNDYEQPVFGRRNIVVLLALASLVAGAALAMLVRGRGAGPSAWSTAALTVVAGCWLGGAAVLRRAGTAQSAQRVGYYAGLLVLLTVLVRWSPWFMLASWTSCVYAFTLFETRWAFFAAPRPGWR